MSTNNPFTPHTSNMFGSRGCDLNAAMMYARELLDNINPEDRPAATTALMVVINTAANAFDQARGPSPERIALMELVDERLQHFKLVAEAALEESINEWMENNFEEKMDEWAGSGSCAFEDNVDERVERWINNNLDISDKIEEAINDMDLVVRVR